MGHSFSQTPNIVQIVADNLHAIHPAIVLALDSLNPETS